ncbi:MAG: TatD family hydrolase [Rhodobacteraceae bacterium]|nr:TatD family hydrolase [Paracoccaceae bacterium]
MPRIVDSHCHLDFPDFDGELDEVIARAQAAGVERMVTICTKLNALDKVRGIAERYAPVFFAAGTHPMSAASEPMVSVDELLAVTQHPKMVGIGETGLDYHYTAESADLQKQSLAIHIEAARQTQLPLIIHSRAADDDMADILQAEMANGTFPLVMHCFSSGPALAKTALGLGGYLSMSGVATFKKAQEVRDIFATAPVERILVETDAPYLAPPPHRGRRNEPAYTALTAQVGADVFGMTLDDFAAQTTENFDRLFTKAAAWKPA